MLLGFGKVAPLSKDMEAFYQELKAMAVGSPDPFVLYTTHQGTRTGRMTNRSPSYQGLGAMLLANECATRMRKQRSNIVRLSNDANEESSTIPDALTGKLREPMTLGEVLRFLLQP